MMFCTIAIVFNDHQRLERVYQFYTKHCKSYSYYSICSIVCAVTTVTIVYAVICVKLIYFLQPLNIITRPPRDGHSPSLRSPGIEIQKQIPFLSILRLQTCLFLFLLHVANSLYDAVIYDFCSL